MEFSGDEKRIQALFSELSLEDQRRAPRFEKLWMRAEAPAPLVRRSALAIFTTVILAAVCLIATWSWYRAESEQVANIPAQTIPTTRISQPEQLLSANSKELRAGRPRRVLRQRQTERTVIHEAEVLANWQSPTNILLNSPTAVVLSSLPQLNQSARELEQFLPKHNEVTKESKQ